MELPGAARSRPRLPQPRGRSDTNLCCGGEVPAAANLPAQPACPPSLPSSYLSCCPAPAPARRKAAAGSPPGEGTSARLRPPRPVPRGAAGEGGRKRDEGKKGREAAEREARQGRAGPLFCTVNRKHAPAHPSHPAMGSHRGRPPGAKHDGLKSRGGAALFHSKTAS